TGDTGLAPVVEDVDFLSAVVVGSGLGVVAGDGGIGGYDLRVGGDEYFGLGIGGPFHHEVSGGGAGAVADLGVIHHAPGDVHLCGEIQAGGWSGERGSGVGGKEQSSRIVARRLL